MSKFFTALNYMNSIASLFNEDDSLEPRLQHYDNKKNITENSPAVLDRELAPFSESRGSLKFNKVARLKDEVQEYITQRDTNEELTKLLQDNQINDEIKKALEPSQETKNLIAKFKDLQVILEALNTDVSTDSIKNQLHAYKAAALKQIDEQYTKDVAAVGTLFEDQEFTKKIGENKKEEVKNKLLDELKKKHESSFGPEKKAEIEKNMDTTIEDLHQKAVEEKNRDDARLAFLIRVFKHNENAIREQAQRVKGDTPLQVTVEFSDGQNDKDLFKDLSPGDFSSIKTPSGLGLVTQDGGKSFTIKFPNRMLSYHHSDSHKMRDDLIIQAYAIRAYSDKIEYNFNHPDPAYCDKMASEMYQACLLAGFSPDKITIKTNRKPIDDNLLASVKAKAQIIQPFLTSYAKQREDIEKKQKYIQENMPSEKNRVKIELTNVPAPVSK